MIILLTMFAAPVIINHENIVCTSHNVKTAEKTPAVNIGKRKKVAATGARNVEERIKFMQVIPCPICVEGETSKELADTIKYLIEYWFEHPSKDHQPEVYERIKYLDRRLTRATNALMNQ